MTNKEAIGHLQTILIYSENDGYTDKAREALKMAIEALKADVVKRRDIVERLYDWADHSITQQEEWHLRQIAGDIKSFKL